MLSIKKIFFWVSIVLIVTACGTQKYEKQESIFILFKTPTFKHADLGFIYQNSDNLKVEIYGNGQAVMALEITDETICMSLLECLDKKSFNTRVLSEQYPEDILNHIFRGEAVFSEQNLIKRSNGFTQKISEEGKYDINYSVLNKHIIFRDTINDILIKVKRLK